MKFKSKRTSLTKYIPCQTDAERKKLLRLKKIKRRFLICAFLFYIFIAVKNSSLSESGFLQKIASFTSSESDVFSSVHSFITQKMPYADKIGKYGSEFCFEYLSPTPKDTVHALSNKDEDENVNSSAQITEDAEKETPDLQSEAQSELSGQPENIFSPVSPCSGEVSSKFGERVHPVNKTVSFHNGIDIGAKQGDEVRAVFEGTVEKSEYNEYSGNLVVISHTDGYTSSYAHMSERLKEKGTKVMAGDVIGYVGSTGISTGPHLHLEIRKDGSPVNPEDFFEQE